MLDLVNVVCAPVFSEWDISSTVYDQHQGTIILYPFLNIMLKLKEYEYLHIFAIILYVKRYINKPLANRTSMLQGICL